MKKIKLLFLGLIAIGVAITFQACSDDETSTSGASFEQVYAVYDEAEGTGTVTIPVRGNAGNVDFVLGGTATEGSDYEFLGSTAEGVQISVLDDDTFEPTETVTIRMDGAEGNSIFELTIISSDCDYDASEYNLVNLSGIWSALEDYGGGSTYGPYHVTMIRNASNPNRFDFDNFYDSGLDAYILFDGTTGTVSFPAGQSPGSKALTASTGTFEICDWESGTLTINLNYDGGPWVYRFTRE